VAPCLDELDSAGNEVCEWRSCPKETSSPVTAWSAQKIGWRRLSDPADDHPDGRRPGVRSLGQDAASVIALSSCPEES
jgi:hypothetical protein